MVRPRAAGYFCFVRTIRLGELAKNCRGIAQEFPDLVLGQVIEALRGLEEVDDQIGTVPSQKIRPRGYLRLLFPGLPVACHIPRARASVTFSQHRSWRLGPRVSARPRGISLWS